MIAFTLFRWQGVTGADSGAAEFDYYVIYRCLCGCCGHSLGSVFPQILFSELSNIFPYQVLIT